MTTHLAASSETKTQYFKVFDGEGRYIGTEFVISHVLKLGLNDNWSELFGEFPYTKRNGYKVYTYNQVGENLIYGEKLAFVSIPADATVEDISESVKFVSKISVDRIINLADWELWDNDDYCAFAAKQDVRTLQYIKKQNKFA